MTYETDSRDYENALDTPELRTQFKIYVQNRIKSKEWFSSDDIARWVNKELLADKVAERKCPFVARTIRRWLISAGFFYSRYQKGIYVDGHDRPDIIEVIYFCFFIKVCINEHTMCINEHTFIKNSCTYEGS